MESLPRVGDRLREMRERQGLSQRELARQLHISHATLWKYEHRQAKVDADDLPRFAAVLGAETCDFYRPSESTAPYADASRIEADYARNEERSRLTRLQAIRAELDSLIADEETPVEC